MTNGHDRARAWFQTRTFAAEDVPSARALADRKNATVAVAIPTLDEEETVGPICEIIRSKLMDDVSLVDELVVLDGWSVDATADKARAAGARVLDVRALVPDVPAVKGKGDALWRGLSAIDSDIVVWIDADIRNFGPHFVTRLVAPLITNDRIDFVKGFYRRPLVYRDTVIPDAGGRVTELTARPLLNAFFPELSGVLQPLAGEYAGRRHALEQLPFFSGYSVEVGLLIDLLDARGLDAIAQADLGERLHRNRPLDELAPMAHAIARTILERAERCGRLVSTEDYPGLPLLIARDNELAAVDLKEAERPPLASLPAARLSG
jgi:glucosyl-3-phosphoglycerate synthase